MKLSVGSATINKVLILAVFGVFVFSFQNCQKSTPQSEASSASTGNLASSTQYKSPLNLVCTSADSVENNVISAYLAVLERCPEPSGLKYWTDLVKANPTYNKIGWIFSNVEAGAASYVACLASHHKDVAACMTLKICNNSDKYLNGTSQCAPTLPSAARSAMLYDSVMDLVCSSNDATEMYVINAFLTNLERCPERSGFDYWVMTVKSGAIANNQSAITTQIAAAAATNIACLASHNKDVAYCLKQDNPDNLICHGADVYINKTKSCSHMF